MKKILKWLLKKELEDCEFQILSLTTELECASDTYEGKMHKLLTAHGYELARKEALHYVLKYII